MTAPRTTASQPLRVLAPTTRAMTQTPSVSVPYPMSSGHAALSPDPRLAGDTGGAGGTGGAGSGGAGVPVNRLVTTSLLVALKRGLQVVRVRRLSEVGSSTNTSVGLTILVS